ncbi:hypothetical protein CIB48_g11506 [Xylaria polymorpha]|nr:hypothetical protein CIB48_g11506 [Xylaria polymorpha]
MDPDDADDGRDEPADSRQERKGHDSFPIAALVASDDMKIIPVENGAARSTKETEGGEPNDRDEEVDGPVGKGPRKGDQPDKRKENGNAGDNLGVDETALAPARGMTNLMEVVAIDACDNGRKRQLRDAEDDGHESG